MRIPSPLRRRSRPEAVPEPENSARRHRLALAVSGACGFALITGVVWIAITGVLAKGQLTDVKTELPQLRRALSSGDFATARTISAELATHAARAHRLTTGPAWWVTANLPFAGSPLQTVRIIATQTDLVGQQVLPGVLSLASTLSGSSLRQGASIDLGPIASGEPVLAHAAAVAGAATERVQAAPATWFGAVTSARAKVLTQLHSLTGELSGALRAVRTLLPMLGQSGSQRYFVGFENEAESRGLGGLPGAFAIVTADHGKVTFSHFENDTELNNVRVDLNFGPEFNNRYSIDDPMGTYVNSDISPNFPYAARIWAAMWQKKSGEYVNGAIAIDPTALSYLLKVTGPALLPDGTSVSAANVVALTEKDLYSKFGKNAQRKAYLVSIAKAVSARLTHGGNLKDLLRAASRAAGERRIVAWSADPAVESNLVASGYAGVVQGSSRPFSGFTVVNAAASKLDYYLNRTMTYQRTGCGVGSVAVATFAMTNNAPTTGLPAYVTIRADHHPAGVRPGDNRLLVTYFASQGATISAVTLDGKPIAAVSAPENGLVTVSIDVELPVGATRTMKVTVKEPPTSTPVQILRQPLVRPIVVTQSGDLCG